MDQWTHLPQRKNNMNTLHKKDEMPMSRGASLGVGLLCCLLTVAAAAAEGPVVAPDWAERAWYLGGGAGQARAAIDRERITRALTANGSTITRFTADGRDTGYKAFVGKQLNRHLALEAGYVDLGQYSFQAATSTCCILNGEAALRGVHLDLLAAAPLSTRFTLLGRIGATALSSQARYSGNRASNGRYPDTRERKLSGKAGLGLEYRFSEALGLRAEAERYRVDDAIIRRGNVDLYSVSLVYRFGKPAAPPPQKPAPEPLPVPLPVPIPLPVPEPSPEPPPVPVSEKITLAAEALFDFDKSIVKPQGALALDGVLEQLRGLDAEVMIVVGHTDWTGTERYNEKLAWRRAEAVKAYIVSRGADPARIYTEGKGETQPVADNRSREGRAKNRRVTVEVVGTRLAK